MPSPTALLISLSRICRREYFEGNMLNILKLTNMPNRFRRWWQCGRCSPSAAPDSLSELLSRRHSVSRIIRRTSRARFLTLGRRRSSYCSLLTPVGWRLASDQKSKDANVERFVTTIRMTCADSEFTLSLTERPIAPFSRFSGSLRRPKSLLQTDSLPRFSVNLGKFSSGAKM